MHATSDTRLWHPFADMGAVRRSELVIDRGEDIWVWDADGRRYLDATASLWYCNVGHGRREIAAAVAAQLGRIEAYSAFGDFTNRPALQLAERLADHAPMANARVFLGSGGGDGIDTAAKLARRFWLESGAPERDVLLVRNHGYRARARRLLRCRDGHHRPREHPAQLHRRQVRGRLRGCHDVRAEPGDWRGHGGDAAVERRGRRPRRRRRQARVSDVGHDAAASAPARSCGSPTGSRSTATSSPGWSPPTPASRFRPCSTTRSR